MKLETAQKLCNAELYCFLLVAIIAVFEFTSKLKPSAEA
jgi:hypothetical protein